MICQFEPQMDMIVSAAADMLTDRYHTVRLRDYLSEEDKAICEEKVKNAKTDLKKKLAGKLKERGITSSKQLEAHESAVEDWMSDFRDELEDKFKKHVQESFSRARR